MKTISQQTTLFGDYYYNSSRKELENYATFFKKYPLSETSDYFKVVMQDILAHIIGSTSFMDACMVRSKLNYEAIINTRIGKKKLVEFIALLEELDKLGIHLDEVEFNSNENDAFLSRVKNNIATCKGINLSYLSFNNLDEFWEMIIMAITVRPMGRNKDDFNVFIPDPADFDFKNNYYETIDYLMYRQDNLRHDAMLAKHSTNGREINLIEWIRKYRERYDLKDILNDNLDIIETKSTDENAKQTILADEFINFAKTNDYGFSEDELAKLSLMVNNKYREIADLYYQVRLMRSNVLTIMHSQNLDLSESEIKKEEQEYVMETVIGKMTGKKRSKKSLISTIYAVIIATSILLPTLIKDEKTLEDESVAYIENTQEEESTIAINITKEEEMPEKDIEEPIEEAESQEEDEYLDEEEEAEEEEEIKDAYVTDFKIGDTFNAKIPYYISASDSEILGFLDEDVIVIGYFGVLEGDKGPILFKSIRNQEEMDKFLRLYHGDHSDIHWRAAVARADNQRVKEMLERGEEIPAKETICYVDCVPVKQRRLIRGK